MDDLKKCTELLPELDHFTHGTESTSEHINMTISILTFDVDKWRTVPMERGKVVCETNIQITFSESLKMLTILNEPLRINTIGIS